MRQTASHFDESYDRYDLVGEERTDEPVARDRRLPAILLTLVPMAGFAAGAGRVPSAAKGAAALPAAPPATPAAKTAAAEPKPAAQPKPPAAAKPAAAVTPAPAEAAAGGAVQVRLGSLRTPEAARE